MKDYKRLTNEELNEFLSRVFIQLEPELAQQMMSVANELLQYRDKIENGTLVELPFIQQPHQGIWEVFFFNTRINGVMYYLFFDKAEAEARLRELKGERE